MNRTIIAIGVLLVVTGVAWPYVLRGLNLVWKMPGNFSFHKGGFYFYFPLTLCLIISIIFSVILMIIKR